MSGKVARRRWDDQLLEKTWVREIRPHGDSVVPLPFKLGATDSFVPKDPAPSPSPEVQEFTVMTWNICQGFKPFNKPEENIGAQVISEIKPDILGLQEVPSLQWLDRFQERYLNGDAFPHRILIPGNDGSIQVALLSKFPIERAYTYRDRKFSVLDEKPTYFARDFLEAVVHVTPAMKVSVFVTHFMASSRNLRNREAKIANPIIEGHLKENPNAFLAILADLNDRYGSRVLRHLNGASGLLEDPLKIENKENEPTRGPVRDDYILVSPGLAQLYVSGSAMVIHSKATHCASDHDPVVAKFRVAKIDTL